MLFIFELSFVMVIAGTLFGMAISREDKRIAELQAEVNAGFAYEEELLEEITRLRTWIDTNHPRKAKR